MQLSAMNKELSARAASHGLVFLGVEALGTEPDFPRFQAWLARGDHAGMGYLERNSALRAEPSQLMPGSKVALLIGLNYYLGDRTPTARGTVSGVAPRIAQYARLRDYHKIMWQKGDALLADLWQLFGREGQGRVVVDSAPILERALAARGGSGFIGKNTCFIHPTRGSFLLLAEILVDLPPEAFGLGVTPNPSPVASEERTAAGGCGTCKRCQVHCPTGALDEAYRLDARKCLAYWTIEHRGTIPETFWPWMRLYFFGCDICQLVCPYNRKATVDVTEDVLKLAGVTSLFAVATMDQAGYERMFGGTPMTRAKREGLMRNALIAMTVTSDPELERAIAICEDASEPAVVHATIAQIRARQAAG